MKPSSDIVLFDLDGTLVDTAPDLHAALIHCFKKQGLQAVDLSTVRSAIGHGAKAMIRKTAEELRHTLTEPQLDEMFDVFIQYYRANICLLSRPFEGITETLDFCKGMGWRLAVCTNKTQVLADQLLSELQLDSYFDAIVGADSVSEKKPSARHITETISKSGSNPDVRAILVGDSSTDAKAARAANIPFVLMTYGYPDGDLTKLDPIAILSSAETLPAVLSEVLT
jgi:phosphoglycolate phosphatase